VREGKEREGRGRKGKEGEGRGRKGEEEGGRGRKGEEGVREWEDRRNWGREAGYVVSRSPLTVYIKGLNRDLQEA